MELEFHPLEQKYAGVRIADAARVARLVASLLELCEAQALLLAFRLEHNRARSVIEHLDLEEKEPELRLDPGTEREQRLVRDLGALAGICRRSRQALGEREKGLPWPAVLRFAWQEAQASFAALLEVVVEGGHA